MRWLVITSSLTLVAAVLREYRVVDSIASVVFFTQGNSYREQGAYDRAIQQYSKAIRLDPTFVAALVNRGWAYDEKDDYDRSIQDCNQALLIDPTDAGAFNIRANAYSDKGEKDRAIQDYDRAIYFRPTYSIAFDNRGMTYSDKGEYDRAIQDYDQAIRLNPNYAGAFKNRADAFCDKGEYGRALQDYDRAILLDSQDGSGLYGRARVRFLQDQIADAVPDLQRNLELQPEDRFGAILLYVIKVRAGQNADQVLSAVAKEDLVSWPGPIVSLFLTKMDSNALLKAARSPNAKTERGQLCQALFFVGEHDLVARRQKAAISEFQRAVNTCDPTWYLYLPARAELERLGRNGNKAYGKTGL